MIANGLRWLHYLTRHFVSQACKGDWHCNGLTLLASGLIPTKCWHTTARVIASAEYAISLDTSLAKLARVIDIGMRLTLLAEWLKPTKCWYTTARVIADGLRWLHYLTRHFVSQACKGDWYWNELDTVSQAIDTYEVLTHNRIGDSLDCADCTISLDTLLAKRLIPTKCWYTTARVIASAEYAISLDTLLAKRLIPTKCWHTTARVIADGLRWLHYLTRHTVSQAIETYEVLTHNRIGDSRWTALIALSHSTLR